MRFLLFICLLFSLTINAQLIDYCGDCIENIISCFYQDNCDFFTSLFNPVTGAISSLRENRHLSSTNSFPSIKKKSLKINFLFFSLFFFNVIILLFLLATHSSSDLIDSLGVIEPEILNLCSRITLSVHPFNYLYYQIHVDALNSIPDGDNVNIIIYTTRFSGDYTLYMGQTLPPSYFRYHQASSAC